VVRQNVALSHGAIITAELVQQSLGGNPTRLPSFDEARDEFTRNYLSQILQITTGNVSQAARLAKRNRTISTSCSHAISCSRTTSRRAEGARSRSAVELRDGRDHVGELRL